MHTPEHLDVEGCLEFGLGAPANENLELAGFNDTLHVLVPER